ncbi:MAG: FISUMP domain-containing protein [Bacteroidota bacterium]
MIFPAPHKQLTTLGAILVLAMCGLFLSHCKKFEVSQVIIVKTEGVSEITLNSCRAAGTLLDVGSSGVTMHGFCWSLTPNPAEAINCSNQGRTDQKGSFSTLIEDLNPATTYYIWAYAEDDDNRKYGDPEEFTTLAPRLPEVETGGVINVTASSAQCGYTVVSDGGSPIMERGLCWGTTQDPTIDGSHTTEGQGTGTYTGTMTGLAPETDYYVRAFAINIAGIAYGDGRIFRTPSISAPLNDERNGKTYQTVKIGEQVWMAQNLDIGTMINGDLNASDDGIIQKYCYQNNQSYCDQYGALYSWEEMMQYNFGEGSQGVCPDGWHIPSDGEWKVLEMTLGMTRTEAEKEDWRGTDQGGKLKATGLEFWNDPNEGATNESGFTALPAGSMNNLGVFNGKGVFTVFWTSSREDPSPWFRYMTAEQAEINRQLSDPDEGASVRCVKD